MGKYSVDVVCEKDNGDLLNFSSHTMPGMMSLGYDLHGNYFLGTSMHGQKVFTIVGRHEGNGIVGKGLFSVREGYVRGKVAKVGYMGGLHVMESHRDPRLILQGYKKMGELAKEYCDVCFTTVVSNNTSAISFFEKQHRGMPAYLFQDEMTTYALAHKSKSLHKNVEFGLQNNELSDFIACYGLTRDGFHANIALDNLESDGLSLDNFLVYRDKGEVSGILGLWRQPHRDLFVESYSSLGSFFSFGWNMFVSPFGYPKLSKAGDAIPLVYGSFLLTKHDDLQIASSLISSARASINCDETFLIGLCQRDPLNKVFRKLPKYTYSSRVYQVGSSNVVELGDRPIRLEVATI